MNELRRDRRTLGGAAAAAAPAAFLALLLALALTGCASANRAALREASTRSAGAFAAGDYGLALELYQKLYESDRADGRIVSSYASMIEDVKAAADQAGAKGGYAAAQGIYRLLADRWDGFSALARRLPFKKADLEAAAKDCGLAMCERVFRQEVGRGDCAKALGAYRAAISEYPEDKAVRARYIKGVAEIAGLAARALEAKEYAQAGRTYALLLKNAESFEGGIGTSSESAPTRESLAEGIRACALALTNGGLAEYRKGDLEGAIAIWEELLSFDPGNAEIKKAAETARAQLGKLKRPVKGGSRNGRGGR